MKLNKLLIASALCFSSFSGSAAETEGKIHNLYINDYGVVKFKIGETAPEECVDSRFPFTFRLTDTAGKEWFDMLRKAQGEGKNISVSYKENTPASCTVWALMHKN